MGFCSGLILGIVALFLPPIPVLIRRGCHAEFLISIGLTVLAWIPGVIYAWYIILRFPKKTIDRSAPKQRVVVARSPRTSHSSYDRRLHKRHRY
ncbi:UPF0057-domain-containing protein [Myriangium duriaei CBS 260.36]|uniref:UPF0057-domain-containing protein n=1 Tax=Myriangium duriaei CBS 260.36 TaxID=1168546 RepID=A0A9P4MIW7_9PEZI|nr:UPF0057-domain-containing protein [Myriangium duriaei CBS 260.36]